MFVLVLLITELCTFSKSIGCSNFFGCDKCDETKCTKCYSFYGFDNDELSETFGQCKSCELRCYSCYNDYKICERCSTYYGVDKNISSSNYGKCLYCKDSECNSCFENYEICTSCKNGYGIDTDQNSETFGKCIRCQSPKCLSCDVDAYKCTSCDKYTILDSDKNSETYNKCISCPFNCKKCSIESKCQECGDRTGKNENGECLKCLDPNCTNCLKNYSMCTKCVYPFGVDTNQSSPTYGRCIECQGLCTSCQNDNAYKCDKCVNGYYAKDTKCVPCSDPNCFICDYNYCSSCLPGYHLLYSSCQKIQVENCDYTNNIKFCEICKQNYYYDIKQNLCIETNIDNCNISLNLTYCKSCIKGFGVDENGKCVQCQDANCEECSNDYTKCTYCAENYTVDEENRLCVDKCNIDNCLKCSRKGGCEECHPFYMENGYMCYERYDPYCESQYFNQCLRCKLGYGYNGSYCLPCAVPNCHDCTSHYKDCNSCNEGYLINSYRNCSKCLIEHCITCSKDISICEECESGYGLDLSKGSSSHGNCVPCSDYGCTECNFNPKNCKGTELPIDQTSSSINQISSSISFDISSDPIDENDTKEKDKKLSTGAIIGISVGSVAAVAIIITLTVCLCHKKAKVEAFSD